MKSRVGQAGSPPIQPAQGVIGQKNERKEKVLDRQHTFGSFGSVRGWNFVSRKRIHETKNTSKMSRKLGRNYEFPKFVLKNPLSETTLSTSYWSKFGIPFLKKLTPRDRASLRQNWFNPNHSQNHQIQFPNGTDGSPRRLARSEPSLPPKSSLSHSLFHFFLTSRPWFLLFIHPNTKGVDKLTAEWRKVLKLVNNESEKSLREFGKLWASPPRLSPIHLSATKQLIISRAPSVFIWFSFCVYSDSLVEMD